jgi:hypothetical protein
LWSNPRKIDFLTIIKAYSDCGGVMRASKIYEDMSAYAIMHDNAATGRSSIVRSIMLKNFS